MAMRVGPKGILGFSFYNPVEIGVGVVRGNEAWQMKMFTVHSDKPFDLLIRIKISQGKRKGLHFCNFRSYHFITFPTMSP